MTLTKLFILNVVVIALLYFYVNHHKQDAMQSKPSVTNKRIVVSGYWLDNGNQFEQQAVIGEYDGVSNDDDIFYYFDSPEEVIGNHESFYITSFQEI